MVSKNFQYFQEIARLWYTDIHAIHLQKQLDCLISKSKCFQLNERVVGWCFQVEIQWMNHVVLKEGPCLVLFLVVSIVICRIWFDRPSPPRTTYVWKIPQRKTIDGLHSKTIIRFENSRTVRHRHSVDGVPISKSKHFQTTITIVCIWGHIFWGSFIWSPDF